MGVVEKLLILSPFGVYPTSSGGSVAVLEPARQYARAGVEVHLFGLGIRKFEALRHFRSFQRELEPGLVEMRMVGPWNYWDYLRRGRSGLPALDAARHLSRRASSGLRRVFHEADLVQYECPWLFQFAPKSKARIVINQNVETALLEQNPSVTPGAVQRAAEIEGEAWRQADVVVCLTDGDRDELERRYGAREAHVIPLGVDTEAIRPPTSQERQRARAALGVGDETVALFAGSWHIPNQRAMARIRAWAAEARSRDLLYVVAGSVGRKPEKGRNLVVTGPQKSLEPWFQAADVCLNPLVEGSGANVKILEFMARGLPVLTTPFGARGLEIEGGVHAVVRDLKSFPAALGELRADRDAALEIGRAGRAYVERHRSWKSVAERRLRLCAEALPGSPGCMSSQE